MSRRRQLCWQRIEHNTALHSFCCLPTSNASLISRIFAIKERSKKNTRQLVQCALHIENKFYYEPFVVFACTEQSHFLCTSIYMLSFHSGFFFRIALFLYLDLLFCIRYIFASVCVHSHAFLFMTYEIFIILEMYAFLSFCFIRKRIEREKPYKNNENMPNIDNNAILYETQVKDLFGLL